MCAPVGARCLGSLVSQRAIGSARLSATRLPSAAAFSLARRGLATKPFLLHDIGEGIAEVEVLQWFVKAGDTVQQFDKICEVQSDKATVEISSPIEGTIESIAYSVGDTAEVGQHPSAALGRGEARSRWFVSLFDSRAEVAALRLSLIHI